MTTSTIDKVALSAESQLPLYILDYFEDEGMFETSDQITVEKSVDEIASYRAKFAASMRSLGFTLDQIVSVILTGKVGVTAESTN